MYAVDNRPVILWPVCPYSTSLYKETPVAWVIAQEEKEAERLFEANKFAYAHNPLEGAAPLQTSPFPKQQPKQKPTC